MKPRERRMKSKFGRAFALIPPFAFLTQTASAEPPTRQATSQWQREDLKVFREKFLNVDQSYSTEAKNAALARLKKIENAASPMEPASFAVELCRIAALADNGHTQCLPSAVG